MSAGMASPDPREDLGAFYQRLILLMTSGVMRRTDEVLEPTLYPKESTPAVLVYVGSPDIRELSMVRNQLPSASYLFYLYPSCAPAQETELQQCIPPGHRTIACPMTGDSLFSEKIGALVAISSERNVRLIAGRAYEERFGNELSSVKNAIEVAQSNAQQDAVLGLIRLRCSILNLPGIWKSRRMQLPRFDVSVPAVVCGAGPSLADQLPMLRGLGPRAVLIAAGHAVPTLVKAGIIPHIVVESDFLAFINWPDEVRVDSLLVAGTDVSPSVAARFARTHWFYGSSNPFTRVLAKWGVQLQTLYLGRTVTIPAIDLAVGLGFKTVALIGQDMSVCESGVSHVDGTISPSGDPLVSVDGNEGKAVFTTAQMIGLKRDMEDYIRDVTSRTPGLRIENCTEGGAVIDGTTRKQFVLFCEEAARGDLPVHLPAAEIAGEPVWFGRVNQLADDLKHYSEIARRLVKACSALRKSLDTASPDLDRIREGQARLNDLMTSEPPARTVEIASEWLNVILHYVDEILRQTPGMIREENDPCAQLRFLSTRFRFAGDICADLISDLKSVGAQLRLINESPGGPSTHNAHFATGKGMSVADLKVTPYVFLSFRRHAVASIREGNPGLASFLEADRPGDISDRFRIRWMNQLVPYVEIKCEDGAWKPLSSFLSMYSDAMSDMRGLQTGMGFDSRRHGLVLVCPGNWMHAFAMGKVFPAAEVMIVDPWPDLLSHLIERGCFLYPLPPRALIVAADARAGQWRSLCAGRLDEWKRAGRSPVFFVPPACRELSGIAEIEKDLRSLC
ncbi:MAG: 6-hydroxymethylpterin diphosphokinase MptE-like protein [bacterium]